jgi:hypothetical protein
MAKKRRKPIEVQTSPGGEVFAQASPDAQVIATGLHELANCVELVAQELTENTTNVALSLDLPTQNIMGDIANALDRKD